MADLAVSFLLENLKQLLISEVALISEVKQEVHQLKNDLALLKAFLKDADNKRKPEEAEPLKEIPRKIRDVMYEVEDTIDSCLAQAAEAKTKNFLHRSLNRKPISLAKRFKSLRKAKIEPILDRIWMDFDNEIEMGDGSGTRPTLMKVKKDPVIREDNVVGLTDEEEIVMNYLMQEREELDIIPIIGMTGLGKTTLAWKIFKTQEIQYQFPTRIWVNVSQEFNRKDVFLRILKSFTSQDMSDMSDLELALRVRGFLERDKYLLVLDDVWTFDAWNDIQDVLPKSNSMGKVLITSRNRQVGAYANDNRKPHMLRFLTEEESWELLQLEVFGNLDDCPMELVEIGRYIAKQCDGLPLAVVVIGGILVKQCGSNMSENIRKWNKVSENVSKYVENDKECQISEILTLSYNTLPCELKVCFIYLGVFPEDYEIPASNLIRLWSAEGFIRHNEGQSLEETAEKHLNDLINMNLVMIDKINPSGQVKTCRVHNVIREFCNTRAANGEHSMFQEIIMNKEGVFDPPVSDIQKYRRLCIHSHLPRFLSHKLNGPGIRSLLCFCKEPNDVPSEYLSSIPDAFNLLRVLESKSFKCTKFPTKITKLIHLRYLTLSCDDLRVLPEAISRLWNLQTFLIDTKSRTLTIKASLWKMIKLRHLKTNASIILARKGKGAAGENLQTLSGLSPEYCTEDVFQRARNLKKLGIRGPLATLFVTQSLDKLDCLENLKLLNDLFNESASENPIHGLPQLNWFPPNLKRLTLSATYLDWEHMSTLEMIDTLQVLKLKDNAFMGESWKMVSGGFPCLEFLLIASTDLVSWEASDDHFPTLKCLMLKDCKKLSQIPVGLAKSLEVLDIERVTKSAAESAREIEKKKKDMEGQGNRRLGGFKLSIGPGGE